MSFALNDTLSLDESLLAGLGVKTSDTEVLTDSFALTTFRPGRSADDNLNLADSINLFLSVKLGLSDTLSLLDSPGAGFGFLFIDSLSLSDSVATSLVSSFLSLAVATGDSVGLSDSLQFTRPTRSSFGDSFAFADAARVSLHSTDLQYLRRYLNDN